MNAIERTLTVISHHQPDRLPVDLHNFQPAAARLGLPLQEVFKNGALIAESQFKPGFILGPGCALDAKTPADNIHALVEAAKKFGSNEYPNNEKYPTLRC